MGSKFLDSKYEIYNQVFLRIENEKCFIYYRNAFYDIKLLEFSISEIKDQNIFYSFKINKKYNNLVSFEISSKDDIDYIMNLFYNYLKNRETLESWSIELIMDHIKKGKINFYFESFQESVLFKLLI